VAKLITYAFVGVSLSDITFMGDLLRLALVNLLVFAPLFTAQKVSFKGILHFFWK